jgi:hypothetical protein
MEEGKEEEAAGVSGGKRRRHSGKTGARREAPGDQKIERGVTGGQGRDGDILGARWAARRAVQASHEPP